MIEKNLPYFMFTFIMMMSTISPNPRSKRISSLVVLLMMVLMVTMMSMSLTTAQKRTLIYHMRWAGNQKIEENHLKKRYFSVFHVYALNRISSIVCFLSSFLFLNVSIYLYIYIFHKLKSIDYKHHNFNSLPTVHQGH